MRPIVCATRGGEVSRRTQERAVALAKERETELIFLCVVDPGFAGPVDKALTATLTDELQWLGRALLSIAQARAQKQGVVTRTAVRCGPAWQNIEEYVRRVNADALVIGAPRTSSTPRAFGSGDVHHLAETINEATGVEVVVVT
ncbi:MAG: universal stress protein [Chloroflexi bacterium]|nr:universal stress protein [Chloroflexota bacterium]